MSVICSVTPFTSGNRLDLDRIADLAKQAEESGCSAVCIGGKEGEGLSMTTEERKAAAEMWRAHLDRTELWVHVGHWCLLDACELARHAVCIAADRIISWIPAETWEPVLGAIPMWLEALSKASGEWPLVFEPSPAQRRNAHIPWEQIMEILMSAGNVAGLRLCGARTEDWELIVKRHRDRFMILAGEPDHFWEGLGKGAHGIMGAEVQWLPAAMQMLEAFRARQPERGRALQERLAAILRDIRSYEPASVAKFALHQQGIDCGIPRLPLMELNEDQKRVLLSQAL